MKPSRLVALLVLGLALVSTVAAHTPLDTGGEYSTPETALIIPDPTKSWTLYEELDGVRYYRLHLHEGERLVASVYVSLWGDEHFTPDLAVMGPDIPGDDEPPFPHPEDLGRVVINGQRPDSPDFEPFTPASYYFIAGYTHTAEAEGDYYVAVFDTEHEGRYGMAVGYRETFTMMEWLTIPLDLVRIHLWEEQPLLLLFGPPLLAALAVAAVFLRVGGENPPWAIAGKLAATLFVASGVMTLTQMLVAVSASGFTGSAVLTLVFCVAQLGLGFLAYTQVTGDEPDTGLWMIALGLAGFAFWAGWLVGPVLALVSGAVKLASRGLSV